MSLQNVAPITDWVRLPGGGETGLGTQTGQIGILSGSVTTATAPARRNDFACHHNGIAQPSRGRRATSTNPIVLENQKQGTPQSVWDIDGAGSSNIEGFATDISVDNGNRIDFKINTNSSNYRIEIYRLGYYGGMGARLVTTIQHTGVQNQPDAAARRDHRPGRCRQLVRLGILGRSGGCRVRRLYRKARAPGRNFRRKSYPVHRKRRQQHQRHRLPDLGHDLAGL